MTSSPGHLSPVTCEAMADGAAAGGVAWALSGFPSTASTLAHGGNPLVALRAAGTLVLSPGAGATRLLLAGAGAHTILSFGWATLFALALPQRQTVAAGTLAGLAVAGLDLGLVGRRFPDIRALPTLPQVADHLAFGALVAIVVRHRRRSRNR